MVAEKDIFSWSAWHNFGKGKVISVSKMDKPSKS